MSDYFVHESSYVDKGAQIGNGTKVWHFSHISAKAQIGENCKFGQNTFVADHVKIGNNCKVQNNVSIYTGVELEDNVFLGPSCVLTNVTNPRCEVNRQNEYKKTLIKNGASVGANATIVCGVTLGEYCFIAAGAVVTKDVPDFAMIAGVPGKVIGWMSKNGESLEFDKRPIVNGSSK
ncbi:MAG: N-acetyltransferase [Lentisphaeraceae bacterium]|nr:N-acetyltransferase [Lentisphaeraceae bacterium]